MVPERIQGVSQQLVNFEIFYDELKNVDWSKTKDLHSSDEILSYIYSFQAARESATKNKTQNLNKTGSRRHKLPWIDDNVIRLCDKRNKLYRVWKNNTDNFKLRLEYNKIRNKVHKVLETKRNAYYIKQINSNFKNIKKVYDVVNQMLGRVTLSIDAAILKAFDAQGLSSKDIANNFANNFDKSVKSIIPNCKIKLTNQKDTQSLASSIRFQKSTPSSVHKIIKNLNSRKAPGPDNIAISDVKLIGEHISPTISDLINCSVKTGKYPDKLKVGCVRPVHKKGKRNDYTNYRPITLLSSIDKIVEKYVCEQIHNFYRKHNVIKPCQFGFQSGKSTTDLLSKFTDEVNYHLNEQRQVLALFIDFSRAFDTLVHDQLIERLNNCGVRGPLLSWCQNYLQNRKFSVKVNGTLSEPVLVEGGTAQGSVLGPLHFLSYVNDMDSCIVNSSCYQFADDTCLVIGDKDAQRACDLLQSDLDRLIRWCHDSGLVLNANKTKLLVIKSPYIKQTPINKLVAHDHTCLHTDSIAACCCPGIEIVDRQIYLGLIIDSKFNWSHHIEHVCTKLRQFLANITILNNRIPFKVKLMLYNALAGSHVQYGLSSYGRSYRSYLDQIHNLQIRILKTIVSNKIKNKCQDDVGGLFKYCRTLPIHIQVQYSLLKEQFFNESLKVPVDHPVCTRAISKNRLRTTRANNAYGERTTGYLIPRLINNLPTELANVTQKNIKYKLKEYFLGIL